MPRIPLIEDLTTGPVPAGSNLLVEYDPASQWFEASITIAAEWIRTGGRLSYNAAAQPPDNIRDQIRRLDLEPAELEKDERLRIIDWYMATLGQKSKEKHAFDSLKVADVSLYIAKTIMARHQDIAGRPLSAGWLRITDNLSCMARFNDEKSWIEFELSRRIPTAPLTKSTAIRGLIRGLHSEWAYKNLEAVVDGIIDFKLEETGEQVRNLVRIRRMRNVGFDSQWHQLRIGRNFEVTLERATSK